jgi:flagellar hook-associated protein 2
MISGLDTESLIQGMVDAQRLKNKRVEDKQTLLTWKQDKWKELNAKLYKLYTEDLSKMRLQGSYLTKSVTSSNDSLVSVSAGTTAANGTHTLKVNNLASSQYVTGGKITTDKNGAAITTATKLTDLNITAGTKITIGSKTLTVGTDTTVTNFVDTAKSAGLNANFDATQGRFFISSKNSGVANGFQVIAKDSLNNDANNLLANLGLDAVKADGTKYDPASTLSTVVAAEDSNITYNGAVLTGSSNVFAVNGLTITLKGETQALETISLNVANDTQATYDMVKKFVNSYNEILKEMNELYYAPSASGYAPLSDDEKEAMTEDQIEKWETKIQDSILRRDSTLGALIDGMRTSLTKSTDVAGKNYSLSSFGIQTSSDYSEKGLLHIYGDEDDKVYATNSNKLMKALEEKPEVVMEALSEITQNLYSTMKDKMDAIPNVRSALTFYNDKTMAKQQTDYAKQIAILEEKLTAMEDKYYKQFAAMETAMAKMQSQSSALAGMFGTSNQ